MKNIITILGAFTVAFGAYYFYVQNDSFSPLDSGEDQDALLLKAEQFLELSAVLAGIKLDTTIFEDPLFVSYQSFSRPVVEETFGRENPFDQGGAGVSNDEN